MQHTATRKATVWALLFLPLVAVGVALALTLTWGFNGQNADAAVLSPDVDFQIDVKSGGTAAGGLGCSSQVGANEAHAKGEAVCAVTAKTPFTVQAQATLANAPASIDGVAFVIQWAGNICGPGDAECAAKTAANSVSFKASPENCPGIAATAAPFVGQPSSAAADCTAFPPPFSPATVTAMRANFTLNCEQPGQGTVTLLQHDGVAAPKNFGTGTRSPETVEDSGNEVITILCVGPGEDININVTSADLGNKVASTCWLISAEVEQESPPSTVNQPVDVVSDNNAKATCDAVLSGPLSDSNPALGNLTISISGAQRANFGDVWHVQQVQTTSKHQLDNTKYVCDLSAGKCTLNVTNVRDEGNANIQFNDPSGNDLPGIQCVEIFSDPPANTVSEGVFCESAEDSGIKGLTLPVGVHGVVLDKTTLPAGATPVTENKQECDLLTQKTCEVKFTASVGVPFNVMQPSQQNLFITKGIPDDCNQSKDHQQFTLGLDFAPTTTIPKEEQVLVKVPKLDENGDPILDEDGKPVTNQEIQTIPSDEQQVVAGAEVSFILKDSIPNADAACIQSVKIGEYFAGSECVVSDSPSKQTTKVFCATKKENIDDLDPTLIKDLFTVNVGVGPVLYSLLTGRQDNGSMVQVMAEGCKLTDQQGHSIPKKGCQDGDLTIRQLEGDVSRDCVVDIIDQQLLTFRWNVTSSSSLFSQEFDLVDTGNQRIDVNDVQFVFGRHGSVCSKSGTAEDGTNPPQLPLKKGH